jgi:TatD DNase family protein
MKNIRLALGLHPLVAAQHRNERTRFMALADRTSYIGEVGLDFSPAGLPTKELQCESFQFVLQALRGKPKFITVHSRRAEAAVLELLQEEKRSPVVFHWYSGSLTVLARAVAAGHFFSINPAMVQSAKGRRIIEAVPPERVLSESDGPFVRVGKTPAQPTDVSIVEEYLASIWQVKQSEARARIRTNFMDLIRPIRDSQYV